MSRPAACSTSCARRRRGAGAVEGPLDVDAHHALAREAAGRSIVLLKNDGDLLPLRRDASVAVIGEFAEKPRYQGAGSSMINPTRLDNALDEIRRARDRTTSRTRRASARVDGSADETARAPRRGRRPRHPLPTSPWCSSACPRRSSPRATTASDIDLPAEQLELLDAVLAVNPNTVVVLSNGGVVALPFADRVPAILEAWLLGQAGGGAIADVLFGEVNPSAKLTETIPLRLEDTPAFLDFPGEFSHVRYGEGLFVGYRWYDARRTRGRVPVRPRPVVHDVRVRRMPQPRSTRTATSR